jgi:predicted lipoprotein with Yx(FWY)xxD motif
MASVRIEATCKSELLLVPHDILVLPSMSISGRGVMIDALTGHPMNWRSSMIMQDAPKYLPKPTIMSRKRSRIFLGGAVGLIAALAAVGCSSSKANPSTAPTSAPPAANGQAATVSVAKTGLGNVLVGSQGRTIYLFQADSGTTSACTGACASAWPPVRVTGQPTGGSGINSSLLGTTARSDGNPQVTYNGHPLYLYVGDQKAGDTTGQGVNAFGGGWFVLSAAGNQITSPASSSGGGLGY